MNRCTALIAASVAAAAVVLTGCSSSDHAGHSGSHSGAMAAGSNSVSPGPAASGPRNDADLVFATDMIPHHRQAVEMADMALATSKNADVRGLAAQIKAEQDPELAAMTGWLDGWNAPVPSGSMDHGMQHEGMSMQGMMSDSQMASLSKATGVAFDKLWLTMMIAHHRGAVSMSRTELSEGRNSDAQALAKRIIASQTGEISRMTSVLAGL